MNIRAKKSEANPYYLAPHEFMTVYHYAMQYNEWKDKYNSIIGIRGIDYSQDRVSGGGNGDSTQKQAMLLADLSRKMKMIERVAKETAPEISKWMLEAVTKELPYHYLRSVKDIPCGKDYFYQRRSQFYYKLNEELNKKGMGA